MRRSSALTLLAAFGAAAGFVLHASPSQAQQPALCNYEKYDFNLDDRIDQTDATMWEKWYEARDLKADTDGSGSINKDADGAALMRAVASDTCYQGPASAGIESFPNAGPGVPDGLDAMDITVGPDTFGYTLRDQADAACSYNFIDISSTGTILGNGDDTSFTFGFQANLGAPAGTSFNMYGTAQTSLIVSTNGFITTPGDTSPTTLSNTCPIPPASSTGGNRLLVLHDDLDVDPVNPGGANIYAQYFATCPRPSPFCTTGNTACTIVQWNNISHFPGSSTATVWDMQTILYHATGEMISQIQAGNPEGGSTTLNSSTTGLHNAVVPLTGLLYSCQTTANGQGPGFPGPSGTINSALCYRHPTLTVPGNCPVQPTPIPAVGGFDVADQMTVDAPAPSAMVKEGTGGRAGTLAVVAAVVLGAVAAAAVWSRRR